MYLGFVVLFLVFCILKLIGFVSAIHSEDPVTLCLSSLCMAQCNITLYIVVFNLDKKNAKALSHFYSKAKPVKVCAEGTMKLED